MIKLSDKYRRAVESTHRIYDKDIGGYYALDAAYNALWWVALQSRDHSDARILQRLEHINFVRNR